MLQLKSTFNLCIVLDMFPQMVPVSFNSLNFFSLLLSAINGFISLAIVHVNLGLNMKSKLLDSNKGLNEFANHYPYLNPDRDLDKEAKLNKVMLFFFLIFLVQNFLFALYFLFNMSNGIKPLAPVIFLVFECVLLTLILKSTIKFNLN